MAIPLRIPIITKISEKIKATTLQSGDKFVFERSDVNYYIDESDLVAAISASVSSNAQLGDIITTMNPSNPTGYVECDNASYNPATYPDFYALFGYTWGNDAGNFRVPDFRGRSPMGAGTGVEHIAPNPNDPLTSRVVGTYYGLEDSTDTDTPAITIGNTVVTGTISINTFTPTGAIVVGAQVFTGTPATLTGAITMLPHHHDVTTSPVQVAEVAGTAVALDGTYTTTDTTSTGTLAMDPYTPEGNISVPVATFTGDLVSPTGSVTLATHTHTASSAAVSITNSTLHPVTIVRFLIKIA